MLWDFNMSTYFVSLLKTVITCNYLYCYSTLWPFWRDIPLQKLYLFHLHVFNETARIQETRRNQAHKKIDNVYFITGTITRDVIRSWFLHTTSTILQGTLKEIYEYGASTVFYTFHYLTSITFLNYINLSSSAAFTINDQNVITRPSFKK